MEKQEIEELLGYSITDNLFKEALGHAEGWIQPELYEMC